MATTTTLIQNRKPLITVIIANPTNKNIIKSYEALIDTGAGGTLISQKIINDLSLTKLNEFVITSDANGNDFKSHLHHCYIQLSGHTKTFNANCGILNRKDIDLIIGMDIIELFELNIKNNIMTIVT